MLITSVRFAATLEHDQPTGALDREIAGRAQQRGDDAMHQLGGPDLQEAEGAAQALQPPAQLRLKDQRGRDQTDDQGRAQHVSEGGQLKQRRNGHGNQRQNQHAAQQHSSLRAPDQHQNQEIGQRHQQQVENGLDLSGAVEQVGQVLRQTV